jgi:hypothetical protein
MLLDFIYHPGSEFFRAGKKHDGDIGKDEHPLNDVAKVDRGFEMSAWGRQEAIFYRILQQPSFLGIFMHEKFAHRLMHCLNQIRIDTLHYRRAQVPEITLAALSGF